MAAILSRGRWVKNYPITTPILNGISVFTHIKRAMIMYN